VTPPTGRLSPHRSGTPRDRNVPQVAPTSQFLLALLIAVGGSLAVWALLGVVIYGVLA
jgi:hypothetical protein